jgi:hypothetical protein
VKSIGNYEVETFDPFSYFDKKSNWSALDFILWGYNGYSHRRAITTGAYGIDRLYREKHPAYMKMAADFVDRFKDYDLIVMSTFNFLHPEILAKQLKKPIKVLGFIDDPYSSYLRGIPFLWAFDGAFYISPSYFNEQDFSQNLANWGCKENYFWPLVTKKFYKSEPGPDFFSKRDIKISYIGNPSGSKVDRLLQFKKHFKDDFVVNGRWPFKGYSGVIRGIFGKKIYPHRVLSITEKEKTDLYLNLKIGLNMHLSDSPFETGNMRMYEVPAHGAMMLCDKAALNAHEKIFSVGEAAYYDNTEQAIEMAEYYLNNETERARIAENGYRRFWRDYEWEGNILRFLDWASTLKKDTF